MMDHLSGGIRAPRPRLLELLEHSYALSRLLDDRPIDSPEVVGVLWAEVKRLVGEDKALSGASLRVLANGMTFVKWNLTEGKARRMVTVRGEGEAEALASAVVKLLED